MSADNRANSTIDWLECAKWLNNLDCLPFVLKHKYMTNQLHLNEFASFLRDGEILCNLLNRIIPGCIDSSQINKKSQMSQLLCLNNIRLFLNVCKSDKYFNMEDSDLFDENMLYDLSDLACVIRTLSSISKNELTIKATNLNGFKLSSDLPNSSTTNTSLKSDSSSRRLSSSSSFESPSQITHDDIYFNIVPTEVEPAAESYYTDESFLLQGLADQQEKSENSVYQIIVTSPAPAQHQPLKRDFVMKEIINTENNFLDGLKILMNDFLIPLGNVLTDQDKEIVFTNMQGLIDLHSNLYNDLYNACKGGQGRTIRICNVFESYKVKLMKEYAKYFSSIDRSRAKCESLMQVSLSSINDHSKHLYITQFRIRLEECSAKSKFGKYKLTDLLNLPYQRVLKYHLLFNELLKQTDVEHSAKEIIRRTKECMCELGTYLNECQRDKENLTKIEQLLKYLVINSHDTTRSSVYSSSFNLNLLKDYGHYIKDDKFRIKDQNERSARTRTFFLFEKALLICKAKGNFYNYKETLLINEFSIEDHSILSQSSSNLTHGIISNIFGNSTLTSNSLNNNLSTSSLNLSSNAHSLHLMTHDHQKSYLLIFKNKEHKKEWKDSLLKAKEKMRPEGQRSHKHFFELTNFDVDLVTCFVCNKYLVGLFYQGYKCSLCSSIAHKECLTKITSTCSSLNALPVQAPLLPLLRQKSQHDVKRSPSLKSNYNLQAEAIYKYDGRPVPPELPALVFNQGDLIQVTDDDDDDWWKGYVISKNKEGFFPRRHVKVIQEQKVIRRISETPSLKLEEYQWYSPVDRYLADAILSRIANDLTETIFMVRCRNEGGYAISIKHKGLIDHIKINIHDIKNFPLTSPIIVSDSDESDSFTHVYCIDQQHNFNSLVALVNYFSVHSLKDNFPQLETSLGIPFRKVLPPYISTGIARHDYNPSMNPNNGGEQIDLKVGRKYFVLNKEANGWWRVYNSEGLIGYVPGSYLNEEKNTIES
ncbi:unnamed protein product [Brachionus calyciflorus]|uniref:Uncharacterized protein n=1 Tax=Brachionus calyciflorus TaxID=104777 RepID=A0A813QAP5_9BILA|nr:unnamed protein product [Brachionus calyciflorus]